MTFIVVTSVEMPLEVRPGWTEYAATVTEDGLGEVTQHDVHQMRFIHYGPFAGEDEAREYAQVVGGAAHELVTPVAA